MKREIYDVHEWISNRKRIQTKLALNNMIPSISGMFIEDPEWTSSATSKFLTYLMDNWDYLKDFIKIIQVQVTESEKRLSISTPLWISHTGWWWIPIDHIEIYSFFKSKHTENEKKNI